MFEKLRRAVTDKVAEVREAAALPPDPKAVPDVHGTSFGALDLAVLGAYLAHEVQAIEPMGMPGVESTSAAREARLRDEGMTEEQLAMVREYIAEKSAEHTRDGWEVVFASGARASVQIAPRGAEMDQEYERLEARWDRENGTDGHKPESTSVLSATVQRRTDTPFESYCLKGKLYARSSTHVATAQSVKVSSAVLDALAAIALVSADG